MENGEKSQKWHKTYIIWLKTFFKKLKLSMRSTVFPLKLTCNYCGKEIFDGNYFCKECQSKLKYNDGFICSHCGRKTLNSEEYCLSCKGMETGYDVARSVFLYDGEVKDLILRFKYGNKRYLADVLASEMLNCYIKSFFLAEAVVYVPMFSKAERIRGYNQSKLLAESFGRLTGTKVEHVLEKTRNTPHQARLKKTDRKKNLKGAFRVTDKTKIKGKRILVIDDVLTTGATAEEVCSVLKKAGAYKIFLLTLASTELKEKQTN